MKKLQLEMAICGAPNVGKSTFMNHFVGKKLSIVSPKVQTTRLPVYGIYDDQYLRVYFTDAPGAFKARKGYSLEKVITKQAWNVINTSENIMVLIDGTRGICENTGYIFEAIKREKKQHAIAVITKADVASAKQKLELAQQINDFQIFEEIYMISAKTGAGIKPLMDYFKNIAQLDDVDELENNQSLEEKIAFSSEITREIIFELLKKELPYSCNVITNEFEELDEEIRISQDIFITRESHKIILVGKKGRQIKEIGTLAIDELEKIYGKKVILALECKIDEKWRENFERLILT
jgi:GTP-binding protein Era